MARFRNFKDYSYNNTNDSVDEWDNRYSNLRVNNITNKTVIRTLVNFMKYGNSAKQVFI